MIDPAGNFDVDAAVIDAAEWFAAPTDLLNDLRLTQDEKRRILESWALDAQLLSQAEAENMRGTDRPRLREVKLALLELQRRH
jgi:hypothetical protein